MYRVVPHSKGLLKTDRLLCTRAHQISCEVSQGGKMVGLLDLPLEIRLNIYELVIYAERQPPLEYSEDESRKEVADNQAMHCWNFGRKVYYEVDQEAYRSNASRLQAVNRQIRVEVAKLIENGLVIYKLDLAVMQGRMLWPTWTSIPFYQSTADIIEVKIRTAGPGPPCWRNVKGGDAGPATWTWWLYTVLEHSFMIGLRPRRAEDVGSKAKPGRKQLMATKVLDLDFLEPLIPHEYKPEDPTSDNTEHTVDDQDAPDANCVYCQRFCHTWTRHKYNNLQPDSLYVQIVDMLISLLRTEQLHYGDILYRGVETVRFRFKGELKYELVIADWLRRLPTTSNGNKQRVWLEETCAIRDRFGLKNPGTMRPQDDASFHQEIWKALDDALDGVRIWDGDDDE